jgi:hypothetical protein
VNGKAPPALAVDSLKIRCFECNAETTIEYGKPYPYPGVGTEGWRVVYDTPERTRMGYVCPAHPEVGRTLAPRKPRMNYILWGWGCVMGSIAWAVVVAGGTTIKAGAIGLAIGLSVFGGLALIHLYRLKAWRELVAKTSARLLLQIAEEPES